MYSVPWPEWRAFGCFCFEKNRKLIAIGNRGVNLFELLGVDSGFTNEGTPSGIQSPRVDCWTLGVKSEGELIDRDVHGYSRADVVQATEKF